MANPTAKVYLNTESPRNLLIPTFVGALDSAVAEILVRGSEGDQIIVVFEGGTPGDTATVSLYGQEIIHQGGR